VSEDCVLGAFVNATVAGGAFVVVYDIDTVAFFNGIVWADISAVSALVADNSREARFGHMWDYPQGGFFGVCGGLIHNRAYHHTGSATRAEFLVVQKSRHHASPKLFLQGAILQRGRWRVKRGSVFGEYCCQSRHLIGGFFEPEALIC